jgi:hypothetical protein
MRSSITSTLLQVYNWTDEVKEVEIGRACSTTEEKRNADRILVGKSEGKRPLGRPRRR